MIEPLPVPPSSTVGSRNQFMPAIFVLMFTTDSAHLSYTPMFCCSLSVKRDVSATGRAGEVLFSSKSGGAFSSVRLLKSIFSEERFSSCVREKASEAKEERFLSIKTAKAAARTAAPIAANKSCVFEYNFIL